MPSKANHQFPSGRNVISRLGDDVSEEAVLSRVSEFGDSIENYFGPQRVMIYSDSTGQDIRIVPFGGRIRNPIFKTSLKVKSFARYYPPTHFEVDMKEIDGSSTKITVYYNDCNGGG